MGRSCHGLLPELQRRWMRMLRSAKSQRDPAERSGEWLTIAGIAKFFCWAYLNRLSTSSPTITPVLRVRTSLTPMIALSDLMYQLKCFRDNFGSKEESVDMTTRWGDLEAQYFVLVRRVRGSLGGLSMGGRIGKIGRDRTWVEAIGRQL